MHQFLALAWPYALGVAAVLLGAGSAWLTKWRSSPAAAAHPIENDLAGIALGVAQEAMALLRSNPTLKPADVLTWAIQEGKAIAPAAVTTLGDDLAAAGITRLTRQSLLTVAQSGPLDAAADDIIKALAPTAATARIAPPQVAAVLAEAESAAPDFEAILEASLPRIAATVAKLLHPAADESATPAPSVAPSADPVLQARPAAAIAAGSLVGPSMLGTLG